ncbi:single-stranded nucleic acid binding R3H domain-containing protein [Solidesulfovibrio carbinoliphilus subsp. oakridgensis]|uniref:RNA-binding protein KhpB n=1 Tax=Solidesulfovibrio carbinoliphilus subsp. oakridgensis TaxID=694327 RepID=G7Q6E0_9BACT|nr:RNA-binding cell elongation regulator Jag/EloR [Solidesulfovibrio carbinoliphilus]EHJ47313.1 single-stranded nucleic acid binding R3H domain-containing protein [Solidesulfovibrio carbinoliphilus subsp. oakridgensis]
MSEFRTFSGKTVDEAMEEACRYFGAPREKLEVEILSGGSSGIFGLVGKKKAEVRARIREEINLLQQDRNGQGRRENGSRNDKPRAPRPPRQSAPAEAPTEAPAAEAPAPAAVSEAQAAPAEPAGIEAAAADTVETPPPSRPEPAARPRPAPVAPVAKDESLAEEDDFDEDFDEDQAETSAAGRRGSRREPRAPREERRPAAPETPPQPMTPELEALVREVMVQMLDGILGQSPEFEITGHSERVSVLIFDEENSGLLIGREGQTLSSIQYLVNRIVIRRHGSPVKVQINTGEYRERQDDNLRKMAIFLADKAKTLGRPQSTKPLSSYHRRVVHLALQEDESISTRSKGEGPLKRVLIVPRGGRGGETQQSNNQRSQ